MVSPCRIKLTFVVIVDSHNYVLFPSDKSMKSTIQMQQYVITFIQI